MFRTSSAFAQYSDILYRFNTSIYALKVLRRWVAKLIARLLVMQLSGFESKHQKVQNGRYKPKKWPTHSSPPKKYLKNIKKYKVLIMGSDRFLITFALNPFQIKQLDDLKVETSTTKSKYTQYTVQSYTYTFISV
jgi:hypothetical protein